jgi:simple sugar transport system ATP-binding protein
MNLFIEMSKITNVFPGVIANEDVDFNLKRGEIRALVGENGAGKSTLMKSLYGMIQPTSGEIRIKGELVTIKSPNDAISMGIGMIHQHFMLIPTLTTLENIIMGVTPVKYGVFIDGKAAKNKVEQLMDKYNLHVPIDVLVQDLSVGDKQRVEILKALFREVDILILDEPTAILTPQETTVLFKMMKEWAAAGKAIVFISHKLREVKEVADSITIMRKGKITGNAVNDDITEHEIATLMVGREVSMKVEKQQAVPGDVVLETIDLNVNDNQHLSAVKDFSLKVRAGEIVGVAGVEGNGQHELIEALAGMWPAKAGQMLFKGDDFIHRSIRSRMDLGIVHVPEDRLKTGLCSEMSLWENLISGRLENIKFSRGKGLFFRFKSIADFSKKMIEDFRIKIPDHNYTLKTLSGGNQQKVVIARELSREPQLLLISQPTRGVDMGAIEFIHKELVALRDRGCAILLVSADLQELMNISDRMIVMYEGEIVGEIPEEPYDENEIGYLMAGLQKEVVK